MPPDTPARLLADFRRHCAILPPAVLPGRSPPLGPAERERLRALGYLP